MSRAGGRRRRWPVTERELRAELSQVELLAPLTYPALRRLAGQGRLIHAARGQIVVGPHLGTTGLFVVLRGSVAVALPGGAVLAYLRPREVFGEIALIDGTERTAICRAWSECLLFEIAFETFHAELASNPTIRDGLERMVQRRLALQMAVRSGAPAPDLQPPNEDGQSEETDEDDEAGADMADGTQNSRSADGATLSASPYAAGAKQD